MNRSRALTALTLAFLLAGPPPSAGAADDAFDEAIRRIRKAGADASEQEMIRLLVLAKARGRPVPASLVVKRYLSRKANASPKLLSLAAESAALAGDYRTAVARYKSLLRTLRPGGEASEAAARLYAVMVQYVGDRDGAYQYMRSNGDALRQSVAARKFDGWFLAEAKRRKDFGAFAARLQSILAGKLPLELERLHYGRHLDWLMDELARAEQAHFAALPHARKIPALLRGDKRRALRYELIVANLSFHAGATGKDDDTLALELGPAIAAARRLFDAYPGVKTLKGIVNVIGGHQGAFHRDRWLAQAAPKQKFFVRAFEKLSDKEKVEVMGWMRDGRSVAAHLASREQWRDLAAQHADLFRKSEATRLLPFVIRAKSVDAYKAQARFLTGVASRDAAVINSLAAGADWDAVMRHLMEKEAWHLRFTDFDDLLRNHIWPAYWELHGEGKSAEEAFRKAYVAFGNEHIARSPLAMFDPYALRRYLHVAFRYAADDPNDKTQIIAILESLDWIVIHERNRRQDVFRDVAGSFRSWSQQFRRGRSRTPTPAKVLEQISRLDTVLKRLSKSGKSDGKGPDAVTTLLARMSRASAKRDEEAFAKAGRELYKGIADFETQKTPFGFACLAFMTSGRPRTTSGHALQMEILKDRLARESKTEISHRTEALVLGINRGRRLSEMSGRGKGVINSYHDIFRDALIARLNRKSFSPTLFRWFMESRRSRSDRGADVIERIIREDVFGRENYRRYGSWVKSASVSYKEMLRHDFPGLREKYPHRTAFADMAAREFEKSGYLDPRYWQDGSDPDKKITNVAARILATHDRLPFGFGEDAEAAYWPADYWMWTGRALDADAKLRDALIERMEAAYGKTRYDEYAMGQGYFHAKASVRTAGSRKEFMERLRGYLERARELSAAVHPPNLRALRDIGKPELLSNEEVDTLVAVFHAAAPTYWRRDRYYNELAHVVPAALIAKKREADLYPLIPHLWKMSRDLGDTNIQRKMAAIALQAQTDKNFDLAAAISTSGLEILAHRMEGDVKNTLISLRSRALQQSGFTIFVSRTDFRYPAFLAQAAWHAQNFAGAWEQYLDRAQLFSRLLKELDPRFLLWLVGQHTANGEFEDAEALARQVQVMVDTTPEGYQAEVRGRLELARADIAFSRREYAEAKAKYKSIVAAKEYAGSRARQDAELKIAEVDRLTKQYDAALAHLEKLAGRPDTYVQTQSFFQMAKVKYDQEEWTEATDLLDKVFLRDPDHNEARILQGNLNLKLRKLVEATDLPIGISTRQKIIVPGQELKITLNDPNLSVIRSTSSIEIRVWSRSGDEEVFSLLPFGDSKTKLRGTLSTRLAPTTPGNNVLEVLGGDQVYYSYSESFRKRHSIEEDADPIALNVRTDAELYASSTKILSKEELAEQAMREMIAKSKNIKRAKGAGDVSLSEKRAANQIKPGNSANIRVIDLDRSTTGQRDELSVKIATTSGDSIEAFILKETGTHTGMFEGAVPTHSAQATAYASDSEEGREPNFAISSNPAYPAWVGLPDNVRPKIFSVDLNDNLEMKQMKIVASEPGRKLKRFLLQTSLNAQQFVPIGRYPEPLPAWDGSLQLELVRYAAANGGAPKTLDVIGKYLDEGYFVKGQKKVIRPADKPAAELYGLVRGLQRELGLGHQNELYIAHLYGSFHMERTEVRIFSLKTTGGGANVGFFFTLDGEAPQPAADDEEPYQIRRRLATGLHRIDVYVVAQRDDRPTFEVQRDIPDPPFMAAAPAELFDPAKQPQLKYGSWQKPAAITANGTGTEFSVTFAPGSRGRILRLVLADFETDAPAINKIHLTDVKGAAVLPAKQDFMKLKRNGILEIVPGDRLTVTYEDPTVITKGKEKHQAFLTATFSDAEISPAFVEYTFAGGGDRKARYIPMARFKPGQVINVFLKDPDGDVTGERDTLSFTARPTYGERKEIVAQETEAHSGIFIGKVFPVSTAPKRPGDIKVSEGEGVVLEYMDKENVNPGIPWLRSTNVEQAVYDDPQMRIYAVQSTAIEQPAAAPAKGGANKKAQPLPRGQELFPVYRDLAVVRPEEEGQTKPTPVYLGGPMIAEILFPFAALSRDSAIDVYVQTSSGRKASKAPAGYGKILLVGDRYATTPLDDGRFSIRVPMQLGAPPAHTLVEDDENAVREPPVLSVLGGDEVFIGFPYKDADGKEQWLVQQTVLESDPFFEVMGRRYQKLVEGAYVGEKLYFRLLHPSRDLSATKDAVEITFKASSGQSRTVSLKETFEHTGVFKGLVKLVYADPDAPADAAGDGTLPVQYGDTLTVSYAVADGEPITRVLDVFKGSDGAVEPFTKRFQDQTIAVQTQFTIAEAYFELAKKHRKLGQKELARKEIGHAKKLLEEAVRDYPSHENRVQADWLIANLALEFANLESDAAEKMKRHQEAVSRFTDLVLSFPESSYAPEAQYKKAYTYEQMGEKYIDQACDEYVKLSYRYPDSPRIADTIARLGKYFRAKGKGLKEAAKEIQDEVERERTMIQSRNFYRTAGEVYGRLSARFPTHKLAGPTLVIAGKCYINAEDLPQAIGVFQKVIADPNRDKNIRAEAMYWAGHCHFELEDSVNAYKMFKRVTWDYPESDWAKFARGRLAEPDFEDIDL